MKEQILESKKEQPTSKIVLEFFRHGEKEKGTTNEELRLTQRGRQQATEKGKQLKPQSDVAVAIGSPRPRTQETASRVMLAEKEELTPEMSLEEIEKIISSEQKYGKKIAVDPRLDFNIAGPIGKKIEEVFYKKRLIHYLIYESDKDALELKDKESTTYSRTAGNIAEIVLKYSKVAPMFDKIVKENPKKYAQYKNQMERYFGSHLGALEPFLVKIVEKTQGIEGRDKFVELLEPGLAETKGFRIEIKSTPAGPKIEIKYKFGEKEENAEISPEILDEIIKEKDELDRKIEEG